MRRKCHLILILSLSAPLPLNPGSLSHSECSSPSLITPPQSPLNLETSSFASSQSQGSISTLPRISVSPVPIGERRKDRYDENECSQITTNFKTSKKQHIRILTVHAQLDDYCDFADCHKLACQHMFDQIPDVQKCTLANWKLPITADLFRILIR